MEKKPHYSGEILNCIRHGHGNYEYPGGVYLYKGEW